MRKLTYVVILSAISMTALSGCKKEQDKMDLSSIHTTLAAGTETLAPETSSIEIDTETTSEDSGTTAATTSSESKTPAAGSTKTKMITYKSGNVSIQYPEVYDTGDITQEAVNQLIKDNALSYLTAAEIDEAKDSLNILCQVVTADRKRLTLVYKGTHLADQAAYPVNVFFTNTIDLNRIANITLRDFVDPYTLAGYVLSGDCQFADGTADQKAALKDFKNTQSLDTYTSLFEQADFPANATFPEVFSYEQQGNIYFTIPVPHALGDYALIKFTPDTK